MYASGSKTLSCRITRKSCQNISCPASLPELLIQYVRMGLRSYISRKFSDDLQLLVQQLHFENNGSKLNERNTRKLQLVIQQNNLASVCSAERRLDFGLDDRMAITDWALKIPESPCNFPLETYNLEFKGNLELIFIIFQMRKWKPGGDK